MAFIKTRIISFKKTVADVFLFQIKPHNPDEFFSFIPGQFCQIKNPKYSNPEETHMFSIASSPHAQGYYEFCIKVYGPWTQSLSQLREGDEVLIQGPLGRFTWSNNISTAIFLAGGVGITPMLSMVRTIVQEKQNPTITLIYGNRTTRDIAYKDEIDTLISHLSHSRVIHVLSNLPPHDDWRGYRGFVTPEILEKEVDFSHTPTFFLCGPPIFVKLMNENLAKFSVDPSQIKQELFSIPKHG